VGAEALSYDGCPKGSGKTEPTTFETLTADIFAIRLLAQPRITLLVSKILLLEDVTFLA
jgi:hypothetical protein